MSSSATVTSFDTDHSRARRSLKPLAAVVFSVSAVWTVLGAHDMTEIVVVLVVAAAVTVGVYGFLMPRALDKPSAGSTALTLSLVATALTLPAFWTGLPLVLGVAGAVLGYVGRNAPTGAGRSIAGFVLGLLATMGYLTIYLVDGLVFGNL